MSISPAKLADSLSQLQQLFTKADTSANGTLSKTEFATAAKGISGLSTASDSDTANLFAKLDTDGDGELTSTELKSGIDLADKVQKALLMAQELTSGKTLLGILSTGSASSSDDSTSSIFGSDSSTSSVPGASGLNLADLLGGNTDTDTSTADSSYASLIQSLISKYTATADAATAPATSTVSQTA